MEMKLKNLKWNLELLLCKTLKKFRNSLNAYERDRSIYLFIYRSVDRSLRSETLKRNEITLTKTRKKN